jgi:heme-degrading monooxygenase HmoA
VEQPASGMVRSVLYLQPKDGDYQAVVDFYRRHQILGRAAAQKGCRSSDLQVPRTGLGPLLVTALWDSTDDYRGWLDNEFRKQRGSELSELVEESAGGMRGDLYEVVLSAGAGGAG